MSDEVISSDPIPPVCRFFRDMFADSGMTLHDIVLVARHTKECKGCEDVIGQMINEKIKSNTQAEASGA